LFHFISKAFNWSFYLGYWTFHFWNFNFIFSTFLYLYWIPLSYPTLSSLFHSAVICIFFEFIQVFIHFSFILLIILTILLWAYCLKFHPLNFCLGSFLWNRGLLEDKCCLFKYYSFFFIEIYTSEVKSLFGGFNVSVLSGRVFTMLD
jgi:hypothetical protein